MRTTTPAERPGGAPTARLDPCRFRIRRAKDTTHLPGAVFQRASTLAVWTLCIRVIGDAKQTAILSAGRPSETYANEPCDTLGPVARAVLQYVFAALLASFSTLAVIPSARVVSETAIVWCAEAEQQAPQEVRPMRARWPLRPRAPAYVSLTKPEPDAAVLFQRPPPAPSLFS